MVFVMIISLKLSVNLVYLKTVILLTLDRVSPTHATQQVRLRYA